MVTQLNIQLATWDSKRKKRKKLSTCLDNVFYFAAPSNLEHNLIILLGGNHLFKFGYY